MRNLFAPRFLPGAEEIVFVATGSVQAPMQPSAVIVEKIKHKHSQKKSSFPLPSLTSALPLCSRPLEFIQPLATRAEAWQAIPGVSEWVMGIIKRGYSLQFARRPPRFSGMVSTSVHARERSRSTLRGDDVAGKRSHRNGSSSFERVRFLQPLLPRPQKGWRPPAHPRSQMPESRPHETAVQDDHAEADPLADLHRGLVLFSGPERCILSHPDSPPITDDSWDSPSREWLTSTRSYPLGCLWPPVLLRSAWTRLFPLWDRWESAFSTTSTTGSFWPSQRWNYFHTEPSSSAT